MITTWSTLPIDPGSIDAPRFNSFPERTGESRTPPVRQVKARAGQRSRQRRRLAIPCRRSVRGAAAARCVIQLTKAGCGAAPRTRPCGLAWFFDPDVRETSTDPGLYDRAPRHYRKQRRRSPRTTQESRAYRGARGMQDVFDTLSQPSEFTTASSKPPQRTIASSARDDERNSPRHPPSYDAFGGMLTGQATVRKVEVLQFHSFRVRAPSLRAAAVRDDLGSKQLGVRPAQSI